MHRKTRKIGKKKVDKEASKKWLEKQSPSKRCDKKWQGKAPKIATKKAPRKKK